MQNSTGREAPWGWDGTTNITGQQEMAPNDPSNPSFVLGNCSSSSWL